MAWKKQFGELMGSGPYQSLPASFAKDSDSNIHGILLAIMQGWDLDLDMQNLRDEERELINAVGKYLEYKAEYWGIIPFPSETTENLVTRADKFWSEFEGGGNEDSIKRALYYYIGATAFGSVGWENTPYIYITDPSSDGTVFYYNDAGVSLWGTIASGPREDPDVHASYWSVQQDSAGFNIIVELTSGSYETFDKRSYEYWNESEKRLLLKEVVNLVKPLGIKYRLQIVDR